MLAIPFPGSSVRHSFRLFVPKQRIEAVQLSVWISVLPVGLTLPHN